MGPLEILQLKPGDSLEKAEKHFRVLVRRYHPDKTGGDKKAEEVFKKVREAYENLKKDPSILDPISSITTDSESAFHSLKAVCRVSLEDIYLRNRKSVVVDRRIFCGACQGAGSTEGIGGVCEHCEGEGSIDSPVFAMLGTSNVCPVCDGSGIKPGTMCPTCDGRKMLLQRKTINFSPDTLDYESKSIILRGEGHQIAFGKFGNLVVVLRISNKEDYRIGVEGDYYTIYKRITPVQRILGDIAEIEVFGRKVKVKIDRGSDEAYAYDKIRKGLTRMIRVKYQDHIPALTEKTRELYGKIFEIEKNLPEEDCGIPS